MNVLEIKKLNKHYGSKHVLKDIDLTIPEGKIVALLGPNGAGKTTLIKSLLSLTQITSGEITIAGQNHSSHESRRDLSYFPEKFFFYPYYTVRGAMAFYSDMFAISKGEIASRIEHIAKIVGITDILHSKLKQISKGQMQRTGLACTFMSPAKLLILDEPFSGLDPIGIKEIRDVFIQLRSEGKTIFINSHILSEVEKFVDEVAIINEGKLLISGTISEVKGNHQTLEDAFYLLVKGSTEQ